MFAFVKNQLVGKRPVAAGEVLRKAAGKAMAIELRVPWKEASGRFQYGLNTPDGVNMVVLMVEDTLQQNAGHGAMAIDGQNTFNAAKAGHAGSNLCNFPTTGDISGELVLGALFSLVLLRCQYHWGNPEQRGSTTMGCCRHIPLLQCICTCIWASQLCDSK